MIYVLQYFGLISVCSQTEHTVYTDAFFENQNIVINALDNLEARRYMDG